MSNEGWLVGCWGVSVVIDGNLYCRFVGFIMMWLNYLVKVVGWELGRGWFMCGWCDDFGVFEVVVEEFVWGERFVVLFYNILGFGLDLRLGLKGRIKIICFVEDR